MIKPEVVDIKMCVNGVTQAQVRAYTACNFRCVGGLCITVNFKSRNSQDAVYPPRATNPVRIAFAIPMFISL